MSTCTDEAKHHYFTQQMQDPFRFLAQVVVQFNIFSRNSVKLGWIRSSHFQAISGRVALNQVQHTVTTVGFNPLMLLKKVSWSHSSCAHSMDSAMHRSRHMLGFSTSCWKQGLATQSCLVQPRHVCVRSSISSPYLDMSFSQLSSWGD